MKLGQFLWVVIFWMLLNFQASATIRYVNASNTAPVSPYTDWTTAATNIQDAVDASTDGDQILVTNGVYQSGGRPIPPDSLTNRVAVDKAVTVQSLNGPAATIIQGNHVAPSATNAYLAVRCVYLTNAAMLVGFTLTNGGTWAGSPDYNDKTGGGIWCETNAMVSNCVITAGFAFTSGGAAYQGHYYNCTIISNTAEFYGGGAYNSTLINCALIGNLQLHGNIGSGGGAYSCTLSNCTLTGNTSAANHGDDSGGGGGASLSALNNCELSGNSSGYSGGGAYFSSLNNCTIISNQVSQWGGGAYNCTLDNCTLTGNSANYGGGGATLGILNNCTLIGNTCLSAFGGSGGGSSAAVLTNCEVYGNSAFTAGGGAAGGTLVNCSVISNFSFYAGGGAAQALLINCTLAFNSGYLGGGTYGSILNNCIDYFNTAFTNSNYDTSDSFNFCCTIPLPAFGAGNMTNAPLFIDMAGGNFRLQSTSPCINAGNNTYVIGSIDLDGRPRIVGGIVDMGAYEFQGAGMGEFIGWLQQYGLSTDGSVDYSDSDSDGMNNWQEWKTGTNPTNALSVLQMASATPINNPSGIAVTWQSVSGITYFLQSSTNLEMQPFSTIQTDIAGQAGTTSCTDTSATNDGPYFYRVGVQ